MTSTQKEPADRDEMPLTGYFTTTVFVSPHLPEVAIITLPASRPSSGSTQEDSLWEARFAYDGLGDWGWASEGVDVVERLEAMRGIERCLPDAEDLDPRTKFHLVELLMKQPFPVMNSPIGGTTLAQLFATSGSGAAFLAMFPHPDAGQIAIYFLVVGGTKIVFGAAAGIGQALEHGLKYKLLKWMHAPTEIVYGQNKKATGREKTSAEKKKEVQAIR
ncbi:hypothetical protein AB4Y32_29630 [Paraburkholderia phymatum]|uniref:Uncharacterized protein n=1 Tax=Paraburkholderia phymatum TaxID=148447 RepID=A0ACC6U8D6_9BURK